MKKANSQEYWKGDLVGIWYFNWSYKPSLSAKEKHQFIEKYILLSMKYGINIPLIAIDNAMNWARIKDILNKFDYNLFNEWNFILDIHTQKDINAFKIPSLLYIKDNGLIGKNYYIGVQDLVTYSNQDINKSYLELFNFWLINSTNSAHNNFTFALRLQTNAFFSIIGENRLNAYEAIDIENDELPFLNTTRLNSYIRDLKMLMCSIGAEEITSIDVDFGSSLLLDETSAYFQGIYLTVYGDVLFYEDIYDLIPEEHRYKLFEEMSKLP